jgi:hypothetical protein
VKALDKIAEIEKRLSQEDEPDQMEWVEMVMGLLKAFRAMREVAVRIESDGAGECFESYDDTSTSANHPNCAKAVDAEFEQAMEGQ